MSFAQGTSGKFWKPGTIAPGVDIEREDASTGPSSLLTFHPRKNLTLKQQRLMLPIYQKRDQLLYALEKYQTVIIVGQTGSGKTTQIPQYLDEAGWTAGMRSVVSMYECMYIYIYLCVCASICMSWLRVCMHMRKCLDI